jgi:hypothetical protein
LCYSIAVILHIINFVFIFNILYLQNYKCKSVCYEIQKHTEMPTWTSVDDVVTYNQTRIVKKTISFANLLFQTLEISFVTFLWWKLWNLSPYKSSKFHSKVEKHKVKRRPILIRSNIIGLYQIWINTCVNYKINFIQEIQT